MVKNPSKNQRYRKDFYKQKLTNKKKQYNKNKKKVNQDIKI